MHHRREGMQVSRRPERFLLVQRSDAGGHGNQERTCDPLSDQDFGRRQDVNGGSDQHCSTGGQDRHDGVSEVDAQPNFCSSAALTRCHSESMTLNHTESRRRPPSHTTWLRKMPSCVAPMRRMAFRERSLSTSVFNSTRMQPSVSKAWRSMRYFASVF